MLIQPTLDTLTRLKLTGMAAALSEQMTQASCHSLSFEERFALVVERELAYRENRRLTRLLQCAPLKERACVEDIDFRTRRGLDKGQMAYLASCEWLRVHQNLTITGACGCGKTWLACALAQSGLPSGPLCPLLAGAASVRRAQARARRWQLAQTIQQPRQNNFAGH